MKGQRTSGGSREYYSIKMFGEGEYKRAYLARYAGSEEPKDFEFNDNYILDEKPGKKPAYYEIPSYLQGKLINVREDENRFGQSVIQLIVKASNELDLTYYIEIVTLTQSDNVTSEAKDFYNKMLSLDLNEDIRFSGWYQFWEDKEKTSKENPVYLLDDEGNPRGSKRLSIKQFDIEKNDFYAVAPAFNWEDIPKATEKKVGNKVKKDFADVVNFYTEKFKDEFISRLASVSDTTKEPTSTTETTVESETEPKTAKKSTKKETVEMEGDTDDLPF